MTLLDVRIRDEWLRVTVTREPDENCASWAGRTDDGGLVTWDARDETRAVPRSSVVDGVRFTAYEAERLRSLRVAGLEGAALGWQRRALEAEQTLDAVYLEGQEDAANLCAEIVHPEIESQLALAMHLGAELCKRLESSHEMRKVWRGIASEHLESSAAYLAGRRDAQAVAQHQNELVQDVLRAALDTWVSTSCGITELKRATAAWDRAGQPGLIVAERAKGSG